MGQATGMMQLMANVRQIKGAVILMYHSIADNSQTQWIDPSNHVPTKVFKKQIAFLVSQRKVVALDDLVTTLQQGKTPKDGTVVITFDDGYLDNLTIAAPILDNYGLSASIFLPVNYIDRGETQWIDQVYCAFKSRTKSKLIWGQNAVTSFNLDEASQYNNAYHKVCLSMLSATAIQRRAWLKTLQDKLQPSIQPPRLTMTWDEIRTLSTKHQCFQIGSHTLEHTDMTNISLKKARHELTYSTQRIKDIIGTQPHHFSFPYGRSSKDLRQLVAETGFKSAFCGGNTDPIVTSINDLYALPRIKAPSSMGHFDMLTNCANTGIWRKLGQ